MNELIDIRAVARLYGVSISTVRRNWMEGLWPKPIRLGRRSIRWRVSDVESFIASQPAVAKPLSKEPAQ